MTLYTLRKSRIFFPEDMSELDVYSNYNIRACHNTNIGLFNHNTLSIIRKTMNYKKRMLRHNMLQK